MAPCHSLEQISWISCEGGFFFPSGLDVWESVVSCPDGIWGIAPKEVEFSVF